MIQKRHVLVALVVLSVALAGCSGWGTDGPADSGDENESDEIDDTLETNESNESSTNDSSDADDGAGAPADDSNDSDGSGASDGGSSDGGTDDSGTDGDNGTSDGDGTNDSSSDDGSDGSDDGSGSDDQDGDQSPGDDDGDEAPYGTLTVTVEDDAGEPVDNIEVVGIGPGGDIYSATTDENGQATFDLEDGDYSFSVTTDGTDYDASSEEELTMEGENQSITLTVTSEQEPTPEEHTLTVTVQNEAEERIEGADVSLAEYDSGAPVEDGEGTTDENGQATFEVPNGDYEILVSHDNYAQPSDDRLVTVDGDTERTITVQSTDDPETYTLTVTGVADGVEVQAEADAELSDGQVYTATASDGQAELEVPEGGYSVTAEGYHGAEIHVDEDTEITLQDLSGATLEIPVVDAQTGEPVPGAVIEGVCNLYYSSGDSYITGEAGEDGVIQAEAEVTPTACDANVYADGYEEIVVQLTVPDDDGLTVELESEANETNDTETNALMALA